MRGADRQSGKLFSYISPEAMVPPSHPLRVIRPLVNASLDRLATDFDKLYSPIGRPSIAPEKLLRALLLQAFFSVRSERQLLEQLNYNMLFRWFVGLSMDAPVWDVTVFTKNRDRLLEGDIARAFLLATLADPRIATLLSDEHFSVDGTLIEAWASMKSFRPKDGSGAPPGEGRNGERDFHGEKRSNETHASTTDPDARLYKKAPGQAAKLCHMGHLLMENRHGLVVGACVTPASGTAEREAAAAMLREQGPRRRRFFGQTRFFARPGQQRRFAYGMSAGPVPFFCGKCMHGLRKARAFRAGLMNTETYATLLNKLVIIPSQKTPYLAVEKGFLLDLMAEFVSRIYVDEPWYIGHSPDVGEAIAAGEFDSATEHYVKVGFYEHRMPYEIEVDDPWYLDNYPDIAEAVATGVFTSGTAHFYRNGYREGRYPHANFMLRSKSIK